MKKKNGFTMMELLAAIVIVGILASAGVVGVINLRSNQRIKYDQTQNNMFVETAKTYFSDNKQYLPTKPGAAEDVYVTLGELMEANYITEEFLDYDGKEYDKDSKVQVLKLDVGVYAYRGSLFKDGEEVASTAKAKVNWNFTYRNETGNLQKINKKNYTNSTPTMSVKATSENGIHLLAYMYTIYRNGIKYETSQMIYLGKKNELTDELVLDLNSEKYSGDANYKIKVSVYDESGYELTKEGEEIVIDTVAPDAPQLVNLYENKWTNSKKYTITGTASDSSGILEWQHTYTESAGTDINNKDWNKYKDSSKNKFTTPNFDDEMDKYVYIRVCDYAKNCSLSARSKIKIDKTAPTKPELDNPKENIWVNASYFSNHSYQIKGTTKEELSGVDYWQYTYNKNAKKTGNDNTNNWVTYSSSAKTVFTTTPFIAERNENVYIRVCDVAGNCSIKSSSRVKIDIQGPNCSSSGGKSSWTTGLTLKGTCTSDKKLNTGRGSSSGCNGNITKSFTTDTNGLYSPGDIYDKAGNATTCDKQIVKVDSTPPTCGVWSGESTDWAKSRTISVGCSDSTSQCTSDSYTVKTFNSGTVRTSNLSYTIKDNAGNTKLCSKNATNIYVDNDGPSKPGIALYRSSSAGVYDLAYGYGSGTWSPTNIMTRATSSDSGSGISYYQYSHDGANWSNSITSLGWAAGYYDNNTRCDYWITWDGQWDFYVRAVDNLGNPGAASDKFTLRIDKTAPTIKLLSNPTNGGWTNSDFSLTGTASDVGPAGEGSGIANWYYTYTSGSGYNAYENSATSTFITTPFSTEGSQNVYIVVCDRAGNCSNELSTPINIDKHAPACSVKKTNTGKTTGVTTSVSCNDNKGNTHSECKSGNPTGDSGLKSDKTYTVYDNANNKGTCTASISSEKQYRTGKRCSAAGCKTSGKNCVSWDSTCANWGNWSESTFVTKKKIGNSCSNNNKTDGSVRWFNCKSGRNGYCGCNEQTRSCLKYKCLAYDCATYYRSGSKCGWNSWETSSCTVSSDKCEKRTVYK